MKKVACCFLFAMLFNSCDDGDLTYEEIDFTEVTAERCGTKLYKINGNEALIMSIGASEAAFLGHFPEEPTPANTPQTVPINTTSNVVIAYQRYNGEVTDAMFCNAIPPIDPVAIESWAATSGTVEITTVADNEPNTADGFEGGDRISAYEHNIVLRNVNFNKSDGTTQLYPEFIFGTYRRNIQVALPRSFGNQLQVCDAGNTVYKISATHAMVLEIDSTLLDATVLNTPRTGSIDGIANVFNYEIYTAGPLAGSTHFCTSTPVASAQQVWQAVSGQVEVTTTTSGAAHLHTIRLKNVILQRGNNSFTLATDYLLGELLTD